MSQFAQTIPGWEALGWILAKNSRDVYEGRYDLLPEIVAWFKSLEMFQEMECERMILKDPSKKDRDSHRSALSVLIGEGERLRARLEKAGRLERNKTGITREDFEASLDHLYDEQAVWHGQMTKERKAEILKKVFNGKGSRA